jgi:hypothetical protein
MLSNKRKARRGCGLERYKRAEYVSNAILGGMLSNKRKARRGCGLFMREGAKNMLYFFLWNDWTTCSTTD